MHHFIFPLAPCKGIIDMRNILYLNKSYGLILKHITICKKLFYEHRISSVLVMLEMKPTDLEAHVSHS